MRITSQQSRPLVSGLESRAIALQLQEALVVGPRSGLVHFGKKVNLMNSITFVLFDKYYPIVDQLSSKDSSRDFQLNCAISYCFTYI